MERGTEKATVKGEHPCPAVSSQGLELLLLHRRACSSCCICCRCQAGGLSTGAGLDPCGTSTFLQELAQLGLQQHKRASPEDRAR